MASITRLGESSMTMEIAVERATDGALLAEGRLRHVFVDPGDFQPREMPAEVRDGLGRFAAAAPVS